MIKPKTFVLSLLLLPYLIWVITTIFSLFLVQPLIWTVGIFVIPLFESFPLIGKTIEGLYSFIVAYDFGIVFWGVPYTFFAIGFFFWSKNKSYKKTYSTLIYSPLALAFISATGIMILGLVFRFTSGKPPPLKDWLGLGALTLLGAALCLLYGYIFVGVGIAGYKLFDHFKLLKNEIEPQEISALDEAPIKDKIESSVN